MVKRKFNGDEVLPSDDRKSSKKKRTERNSAANTHQFRQDLFNEDQIQLMKESYAHSKPYKYGVLHKLINDELLHGVLEEVKEINFTMKETDIYRIYQSGDLKNLDGIDAAALSKLPNLLKLRNALYSERFRNYLSMITGAGALSGTKTDMAINIYKPGCHLLCHDDVIGSRRVSYILYLTEEWNPKWGGALRLYPTRIKRNAKGHNVHVPTADFTVSIPPAWNQMSFFAVQPGESYHDVEEVYHQGFRSSEDDDPTPDDKRTRIAISGWFHIPQPGESDYQPGIEEKVAKKSSLVQLKSNDTQFDFPETYPVPFPCYPLSAPQFIPPGSKQYIALEKEGWKLGPKGGPSKPLQDDYDWEMGLTEEDCNFLLQFMNPRFLVPETVNELNREFSGESSIEIDSFLSVRFADALKAAILREPETCAESTTAVCKSSIWSPAEPPHKRRFLYILPTDADPNKQNLLTTNPITPSPVRQLLREFLNSMQFRKWLGFATGIIVKSHDLKARRFRRGLDYQLATSYDKEEPRLELTLGMSPRGKWEIEIPAGDNGDDIKEEDIEAVHNGGEECYMAGEEQNEVDMESEEDEQMSSSSSDSNSDIDIKVKKKKALPKAKSSNKTKQDPKKSDDPAVYNAADDGGDDILFHMVPCFNRLALVLRDQGTLKYVRFVNTSAGADRWDISGDYEVDWPKTEELDLEVEDIDEQSVAETEETEVIEEDYP